MPNSRYSAPIDSVAVPWTSVNGIPCCQYFWHGTQEVNLRVTFCELSLGSRLHQAPLALLGSSGIEVSTMQNKQSEETSLLVQLLLCFPYQVV